jgi:putative acetyltransferase
MLNKKNATKNDYKLILEIWEKSVKKTHHFLSKEDFEFYKKIIPENLDYVSLYLWEDDNKVIGFSGINNDELVMLFLDPEFIGNGYGSKILLDLVENESIKRIDVNTQNEYAKKFYLTHGFEIESEDEVDGFGKPYPITHLNKK